MRAILALAALLMSAPAAAQHAHHDHAEQSAAAPACSPEHAAMGHCQAAAPPAPATDPNCPPEHAAMGHCTPATPAASAIEDQATGTSLPAGKGAAPPPPTARAADRFYPPADMAKARVDLHEEHGGGRFAQLVFDISEYRPREGSDGFHWNVEGWWGGDIDRLVLKSEGEGAFGKGVEDAEIQALWSHALDPYRDLQLGVRHDVTPNPSRTHAVLGVEGLAPYWFEVEAALFLSDKGDLQGRIEASYDQRITQRLILQPRAELNLAAQDMPEYDTGSGLSDIELGLRLRYEISREFAPYVGIVHERKLGDTARFARHHGEDRRSTSLALGIRAWF